MENLAALRKKVDSIDASIIELISRRLDITNEIGNFKKARGMPVYDKKREMELERRWLSIAKRYALDRDIATQVLGQVLRFSKMAEAKPENGIAVVIVGTGSMAEALGMLIRRAGYGVFVTGRNKAKVKMLAERIGARELPKKRINADYAILCVPPEALNESTMKLMANCNVGIVMDVSSSKADSFDKARNLASAAGNKFVSTHPLFGLEDAEPGARIAIITDKAGPKEIKNASRFWTSTGLRPVLMSINGHEKAMAVSQVLRHAFALGFYDSVVELSKELHVDYGNSCTSKFSQMLDNAKAIKSEEWVAAEIAESNLYSKKAYAIAKKNLEKHANARFLNLK